MPYSKALAAELTHRRQQARLSQDEVCRKTGIKSQNAISILERNVPDQVSMESIVKIGALYGLTPNELAEKAGWWHDPEKSPRTDPRIRELLQELPRMDSRSRVRLIDMIYNLLVAFRVSGV